ncbi:MAG: DUF1640 domain-containing protein [Alphaproteobacteria bacterium]|nr:DUF1640 domain-containing protein [Alphaproteobacteria bacterium]
MKKVILGVALLAQFTYGMERDFSSLEGRSADTTTLVSSRFLEESEARFRTHLESVLRGVTEGSIAPESAIISIGGDHRESLVLLRSSLNQGYLEQIEEQRVAQEELIHRITAEKEHEIQALQERLDTLLHASGSISESFRIFDQERRHVEENVRRAKEQAEHGEIPELVTERQVDRTSRRFSEQLDEIKREVQESRKTLEEAFERTQEKYSDNIDALIGNLQDRYEDILAGVTAQYNERRERIEEAYEQQKALMQRMIDEVAAINLKLEKEKEFKQRIGIILSHNQIDPRDIIKNTDTEFLSMDLPARHNLLLTIYNKKILPFAELLESSDLSAIRDYISAINVSLPRDELGDFQGYYFGWGAASYTEWNYRNISEIRRAKSYGANIPGHEDYQYKHQPCPLTFWANAAHANLIESERQRINNIIREEQTNYKRATELVFPTQEFKRLVDKVNSFFKEFL